MPPPAKDGLSKDVHIVLGPRFHPQKKAPSHSEVLQAPNISNCYLAAMLAAHAFTPDGQKFIDRMVTEQSGNVQTDVSGLPAGTLSNPPSAALTSSRFFTVQLPGAVRFKLPPDADRPSGAVAAANGALALTGGSIDVSDVLYTNDSDRGPWAPLYLSDPVDHTIWAAVIEKAVAVRLGGYQNFDDLRLRDDGSGISVNDMWEMVTGLKPGGLQVSPSTPLSAIIDAAKASVRTPSIAATKANLPSSSALPSHHGLAMLGLQGDKLRLYDPAEAKEILISPADFRNGGVIAILHN